MFVGEGTGSVPEHEGSKASAEAEAGALDPEQAERGKIRSAWLDQKLADQPTAHSVQGLGLAIDDANLDLGRLEPRPG